MDKHSSIIDNSAVVESSRKSISKCANGKCINRNRMDREKIELTKNSSYSDSFSYSFCVSSISIYSSPISMYSFVIETDSLV